MANDSVESRIRRAAEARGLNPDVAVRIVMVESGGKFGTKNPRSSAAGLFQVTDGTWKQYGGKPGHKFDVTENIRVGLNIMEDNQNFMKARTGRGARPEELYALHHFGKGDGMALLQAAPGTPLKGLFSPDVIKANPNLKNRNAGQLLAGFRTQFAKTASKTKKVTAPTPVTSVSPSVNAPVPRKAAAVPVVAAVAPPLAATAPETVKKPAETVQKPAETAQKPAETVQKPAETVDKADPNSAWEVVRKEEDEEEGGADYQAALALAMLDEDGDKEDKDGRDGRDYDDDDGETSRLSAKIASLEEKLTAKHRMAAFSDENLQVVSPFEAKSPIFPSEEPVYMASGGYAYNPVAYYNPTMRRQLKGAQADFDRYNKESEAYNALIPKYDAEVKAHNEAIEKYNISMPSFLAEGGEPLKRDLRPEDTAPVPATSMWEPVEEGRSSSPYGAPRRPERREESSADLLQRLNRIMRLSGEMTGFRDGDVRGTDWRGNLSISPTPGTSVGLDFSGYRVKTPYGTFSDSDNPAATFETQVGPGTLSGGKSLRGDGWGVQYAAPLAEGGDPQLPEAVASEAQWNPTGGHYDEQNKWISPFNDNRTAAQEQADYTKWEADRMSRLTGTGTQLKQTALGVGDAPAYIAGAPVDIAHLVTDPIYRLATGKSYGHPVGGSEWMLEKATKAGLRAPPPEGYEGVRMASGLAASIPTFGPVTSAVKGIPAGLGRARDLLRSLKEGEAPHTPPRGGIPATSPLRQADAPATSPLMPLFASREQGAIRFFAPPPPPRAPKVREVAPPIEVPAPTLEQPFYSPLEKLVAGLPGPVSKQQFLGQIKGKFRDHDIERAEAVLADLPVTAKLTPQDLYARISGQYSPREWRASVIEPEAGNSLHRTVDNPWREDPSVGMGSLTLRNARNEVHEEVLAQADKDIGSLGNILPRGGIYHSPPSNASLAERISRLGALPGVDQTALAATTRALEGIAAQREAQLAAHEERANFKYVMMSPYHGPEKRIEAMEKLSAHLTVPERVEARMTLSANQELSKGLTDRLSISIWSADKAERDELFAPVVAPLTDLLKSVRGMKPYEGAHGSVTGNVANPIGFSRFTEHTVDLPKAPGQRVMYLHEAQSDMRKRAGEFGVKGGSWEKDQDVLEGVTERFKKLRADTPIAGVDDLIRLRRLALDYQSASSSYGRENIKAVADSIVDMRPTLSAAWTTLLKDAKVVSRTGTRDYNKAMGNEGLYALDEPIRGMEGKGQAIQQLLFKNAIHTAMQRGLNGVAIPSTNAQGQLYKNAQNNLKQVIKDLGKQGLEIRPVEIPVKDGDPVTTFGVFWSPEASSRVLKAGIPFKSGGMVERAPEDNRRYL